MSTSLKKLETWEVEGFYTQVVMISPSIKYAYKPRLDDETKGVIAGIQLRVQLFFKPNAPVVVRDKSQR